MAGTDTSANPSYPSYSDNYSIIEEHDMLCPISD